MMSITNYIYKATAVVVFLFISAVVSAGNFRLDVSAGAAFVGGGDYDPGYLIDHNASYATQGLVLRVGGIYIDELSPEGAEENTEVEIGAGYIGVAKEFKLKDVKIELGGGLIYAETEARFLGRKVAEETDTSPYIDIKAVIDLNDLFSVQWGWKYIDDISGGDLHLPQAGIRFNF